MSANFCGGGKSETPYCKFLTESNSERILKIDQHLAKLLMKKVSWFFLTHSIESKQKDVPDQQQVLV